MQERVLTQKKGARGIACLAPLPDWPLVSLVFGTQGLPCFLCRGCPRVKGGSARQVHSGAWVHLLTRLPSRGHFLSAAFAFLPATNRIHAPD